MAGRITELTPITAATAAGTDLAEVVDISDTTMAATGTNKQLPLSELVAYVDANSPAIAGKAPTAHTHTTTSISSLDASDTTTGVFAAARLALSGTADATTFLRGDRTWAVPAGGGGAPSGPAGGVLSGTYPDPGFAADMATQAELDAAVALRAPLAQTVATQAATTYTALASDAGKIISLTATCTVTLPSAGPTAGQHVDFVCVGGPATFVLGGGATWHVNPTPSAVARAVGSWVSAIKITSTAWALTGDLA